jgi:hypothetical protein
MAPAFFGGRPIRRIVRSEIEMNWTEPKNRRLFWAAVQEDVANLIRDLTQAEEDEEVDLYRFNLYASNAGDLEVFSESHRAKVAFYLNHLIADTRRHARWIRRLIRVLKRFESRMREEAAGHG